MSQAPGRPVIMDLQGVGKTYSARPAAARRSASCSSARCCCPGAG